jgi:hypothetical protein
MKIILIVTALASLAILAINTLAAEPTPGQKLLHVVSIKFKESASKEQVQQIEAAFRALKTKIPQIQDLTWGTNVSPEKHDKGFTHGFILSFASAADRDAYLVHPEHKAFGKMLGPVMGDVFVIDFWAQK